MSSQFTGPIEPSPRIPAPLVVAVAVSAAQVGAFYAATLLSSWVKLPIRRGFLLLAVILVAGALASAAVRRIFPHHGSGYAISLLATAGFILAFMAVVSAGYQLVGLAVLVPAGGGSFVGALTAAHIRRGRVVQPVAEQEM